MTFLKNHKVKSSFNVFPNLLVQAGTYIGDDHKEYFSGDAALKAGGKENTMNQFETKVSIKEGLIGKHIPIIKKGQ